MFAKNQRITKKEEFNFIYKNGKTVNLPYLKIFYIQNSFSYNRFSILVSKKTASKATQRNYIKRKIRHILIDFRSNTEISFDIIIIAYKGIENVNICDLKENFKIFFNKSLN